MRKTISDSQGDRLILFGLVEAGRNASEIMAHELYARYKGPMGVWNVTIGRFGVPFGLLVNFSTTRLLYRGLDEKSIGFDVDNGVMVSGTAGSIDYAATVTQGYGPHHPLDFGGKGMGSGRIGTIVAASQKGEYGAIEFVFGMDTNDVIAGIYIQRSRERDTRFKDRSFLDRFPGKGLKDGPALGIVYKGMESPGTEAVARPSGRVFYKVKKNTAPLPRSLRAQTVPP